MNVRDLIAVLEDMPEDAEVRMAHQPSWPFEYSIDCYSEIVLVNANDDSDEEEDEDDDVAPDFPDFSEVDNAKWIVYLPEGEQIGYLPGNVSHKMGWR